MPDDTTDTIADEQHDLLFSVRRSRRYHLRREQFFLRLNFISTLLTALSGSATFATVLADSVLAPWFALLTAVAAAVELAGQTGTRARLHRHLAREFTQLERDMVVAGQSITIEQLNAFTSRRMDIELEEPPALEALNNLCHNAEVRARGYPAEHLVDMSLTQRLLASLFDLRPGLLRKRSDAI